MSAWSVLKLPVLAAACGFVCCSCSIPVTGPGSIPKAAASVQVGKTTFSELEDLLGKPAVTDQKGDRRIANWSSSAVGMGAGTFIGSNDVIFESLGVEYSSNGTVNRSVSHGSKRRSTLATPFQTSHVAGATREPGRFAKMKRASQIEAELGPPQFKLITLEGESWRWVGYPGAPGNAILVADLDRQGRILRTSLH
jgi:hypothetical protein